jgi:ribosomal protein S6
MIKMQKKEKQLAEITEKIDSYISLVETGIDAFKTLKQELRKLKYKIKKL